MNKNWEIKKLSEVCDLQNGFAFKSKDYISFSNTMNFRMSQIRPGGNIDLEKNPKFLPDDYSEKYKVYVLKEGDVVIAMTDLATETKILGVPTIMPEDSRVWLQNQRVGKFYKINYSKINLEFLKYILSSYQINEYYKSLGKGGLQINIRKQDILNAQIPIPPLPEQKRIVTILDKAFSAIDKAKQNAEANLKNAKEVFESYLQNVFENKGDDWDEKAIKDLTELVTKGSSPNWQGINYVDEGGIFFLTSKNVGEGKLLLDNMKYLEAKFNKIQAKSILKKGDVLTNIVGASIGRTAIFDLDEITNINQAVCLMRCLPEKVFNHYLMYLLNSPFFKNILHDNEVNNARANLSLTFFKNLIIPLPTLSEQKIIVEDIKRFAEETKKLETIYQQKIDDLEELRKSVLQKSFNGEL